MSCRLKVFMKPQHRVLARGTKPMRLVGLILIGMALTSCEQGIGAAESNRVRQTGLVPEITPQTPNMPTLSPVGKIETISTPTSTSTATASPTPVGLVQVVRLEGGKDLDWSPEGDRFAVGTRQGLHLLGIGAYIPAQPGSGSDFTSSGRFIEIPNEFKDVEIDGLDFSPDGQYLAISERGYFAVLNPIDGKKHVEQLYTINIPAAIQFVNGTDLLLGFYYLTPGLDTVKWRIWGGPLDSPYFRANFAPDMGFALSQDGQLLAFGSSKGIEVWRSEARAPLATLSDGEYPYQFADNGKKIIWVSATDCSLKVWSILTHRMVEEFPWCQLGFPTKTRLYPLVLLPERSLAAAASRTGVVLVWNWLDRGLIAQVETQMQDIVDMSFSPDGSQLAVLDGENGVSIWATGQ